MDNKPYKIFDGVLDEGDLFHYRRYFKENTFPWYYHSRTTMLKGDDEFMFTHTFFNNGARNSERMWDILDITTRVAHLSESKNQKLMRIKSNLYTNQGENTEMKPHKDFVDLDYDFKTCIFNLTTCNGGTVLLIDNEEVLIPSVENQLIVFDGNIEHFGITQTDKKVRVLINYNFS